MDDLDLSYFEDTDFSVGDLGGFDDFSGFDNADVYTAYDDTFSQGINGGGIMQEVPGQYGGDLGDNIFDAVKGLGTKIIGGKLSQSTSRPASRPENTKSGIASGIFEAVYQYGRGRLELGLESAIKKSSAGQKAIKNIEQERIKMYMPWVIGGAILLFLGGLFLARR